MANQSVPGRERTQRVRATLTVPTPTSAEAPEKRGREPLLAAICHDLRAPLAAVTMGASFVLQTTQRDEAHARSIKILEAMLRSCTQMDRLIRNFADLSEIESHAMALRLGIHDAREMLEVIGEGEKEAAGARSVTIEVTKSEAPIPLRCDRERLQRAITHVVENAITHAPEGSVVSISAARSDGTVSFSVVDRGPGLSPEVMSHLGEREWLAKHAGRVGAGFGLAIARGFFAAHDGGVDVSRADNETTFTLSIPTDGPTSTR